MSKITYETVSQAADLLQKQGHRVSVRSVIKELGGGSPNTVTPLLKQWRSVNEIEGKPVELDPRLGLIIQEMVASAISKAVDQARETIETLKEDMESLSQELEASVQRSLSLEQELSKSHALIDESDRLLSDAQLAAALEAKHLQQEIDELRSALHTERKAHTSTGQQLAKAQAHLEDKEEIKAELSRLRPYENKVTALEATVASQEILLRDLQARLEKAYQASDTRS